MNGYLSIWILPQKIEKLEEELSTYKNRAEKTEKSVQGGLPAALFLA